ncbi:putative branched-chain amino acid transport ATP-binding protein LivG [uncultured archaeon]|nr:putative branched-chain amino acid transport ATP-binding protein LivG [uncultured archaeon]
MTGQLEIVDLHVSVGGKEILKGITLTIHAGEVVALMGPNGSGKSTLSYAIAGHPDYEITRGSIILNGKEITRATADERSRQGLFLSFQYPVSIPGVTVANFLRTALNAHRPQNEPIDVIEFYELLNQKIKALKISEDFVNRHLNEGFSGGEKKRMEILQMSILTPNYAILDETDSGLDVDALKIVAEGINAQRNPNLGVLLITHYERILSYIKPDKAVVMVKGRIMDSGGPELVRAIEAEGYDRWVKE